MRRRPGFGFMAISIEPRGRCRGGMGRAVRALGQRQGRMIVGAAHRPRRGKTPKRSDPLASAALLVVTRPFPKFEEFRVTTA